MKKRVLEFLKKNYSFEKPLVLGLSGGPDSLALFHILLEIKVPFVIAHINHNWRRESQEEVKILSKLASDFCIPFYLRELEPANITGNLEEECRKERLKFFKELYNQLKAEAVLLAHHQGDQSETVLKRIFEGASLIKLKGLEAVSFYDDMALWRPLLSTSKSEILNYVEEKKLHPFHDKTNFDTKLFRGKCRSEIIPFLSKSFGKEVQKNLAFLGNEAAELNAFLKETINPYLKNVFKSNFGTFLDLSSLTYPFLMKTILRTLAEKEGFYLSREQLQLAVDALLTSKANVNLIIGKKQVIIDRKRVFIVNYPFSNQPKQDLISECRFGPWKIKVSPYKEDHFQNDWKGLFQNGVQVVLPTDNYQIGFTDTKLKIWEDKKIPTFLRKQIPVIWKGEKVYSEFLTFKEFDGKDKIFIQLSC